MSPPLPDDAASEKPASEKPASEKPASEKPASEKPASEKPASGKSAHRIRLRRPWVRTTHPAQADSATHTERVDVPDEDSTGSATSKSDHSGHEEVQITYTRNFNAPSGIGTGDRVFLEVAPSVGRDSVGGGDIFLNESPVTKPTADGWYEITELLEPSNLIEVRLNARHHSARLSAEVNLQIVSGG